MEGFSYTNIFETKGIEYLAIIGFFLLLVPFWILLNKQAKIAKQLQKVLGILSATNLKIPQGLFFTKNHTWAHMERSGDATVGVDDLLVHITGDFTFNGLKNPGETIKKGDLLTEIDQNGKMLKVYSPISGKILKSNSGLVEAPDLLSQDPCGKGWIYKIKPSNWVEETHSYYLGEDATNWSKKELDRFKDFMAVAVNKYSTEPSMVVLQDGGELREHVLSELPDEIWKDFQQEFLNPN
jgi:glycine cleavage system H protein